MFCLPIIGANACRRSFADAVSSYGGAGGSNLQPGSARLVPVPHAPKVNTSLGRSRGAFGLSSISHISVDGNLLPRDFHRVLPERRRDLLPVSASLNDLRPPGWPALRKVKSQVLEVLCPE
ncbi:hypothetical protein NCCP436_33320 [Pseudomonas sp. NCCP-436]|nr:hypothetical protein NCCP436_33320 [Pseudomonas sp. NCCP-436]